MSTVTLDNKTILVTGAAGFIGSNLVKRICQEVASATVIGIDNMNAYYDVSTERVPSERAGQVSHIYFCKRQHR
ncbi:NAD-dependent epimerase/dehydratase family protein [uncultured Agathobaculum sp.]|uniref:NAD-dependent epimerase/dehydratase family protein n=1 Tax=uncultured Agathobaculum sp. TaxID=2048140 RepID=UPI00296F2721